MGAPFGPGRSRDCGGTFLAGGSSTGNVIRQRDFSPRWVPGRYSISFASISSWRAGVEGAAVEPGRLAQLLGADFAPPIGPGRERLQRGQQRRVRTVRSAAGPEATGCRACAARPGWPGRRSWSRRRLARCRPVSRPGLECRCDGVGSPGRMAWWLSGGGPSGAGRCGTGGPSRAWPVQQLDRRRSPRRLRPRPVGLDDTVVVGDELGRGCGAARRWQHRTRRMAVVRHSRRANASGSCLDVADGRPDCRCSPRRSRAGRVVGVEGVRRHRGHRPRSGAARPASPGTGRAAGAARRPPGG